MPANRALVYGTENEHRLQIDLTQIRALPAKTGDLTEVEEPELLMPPFANPSFDQRLKLIALQISRYQQPEAPRFTRLAEQLLSQWCLFQKQETRRRLNKRAAWKRP